MINSNLLYYLNICFVLDANKLNLSRSESQVNEA